MSSEEQKDNVYFIPDNFFGDGRAFNGMFKTKNAIEALILGGSAAGIALLLPITNISIRITVVMSFALPFFFVAILGINEDSLFTFLRYVIDWKRNKRIMLYNEAIHAQEQQPLDMLMAEELPRDRLITIYEDWQEKKQAKREAQLKYATYTFEEDESLKRLKTPKQRAAMELTKDAQKNKIDMAAITEVDDLDNIEGLQVDIYTPQDTHVIQSDEDVTIDEDLY